jgi:glycosyltransferase involved in cell wall biosynthesis
MNPPTGPTTASRRPVEVVSNALVLCPVPLGAGGIGTAAGEFAAGLGALGVDWSFIASPPPGPVVRAARSRISRRLLGDAPVRRLTARSLRRSAPATGWQLAYATPSVLPEGGPGTVRAVLQATRHPAIEYAALRAGEKETGGRGDLSAGELRRRERELTEVDLVHCTSLAVRDELFAAGIPAERLVHAYHGVDVEQFETGPKADDLRVAFVGPLSLRKGIDVVADLARRLQGQATVETVGGPSCPWSRRIADEAPFVARQSVPKMLRGAQALVLPSRSDGFSYVVLEAMASGAVPLVTPEVGAAEIVRRLDERLVIGRDEFVEAAADLVPRLDYGDLAPRARTIAEELDRKVTSKAVASAIMTRAEALLAR